MLTKRWWISWLLYKDKPLGDLFPYPKELWYRAMPAAAGPNIYVKSVMGKSRTHVFTHVFSQIVLYFMFFRILLWDAIWASTLLSWKNARPIFFFRYIVLTYPTSLQKIRGRKGGVEQQLSCSQAPLEELQPMHNDCNDTLPRYSNQLRTLSLWLAVVPVTFTGWSE